MARRKVHAGLSALGGDRTPAATLPEDVDGYWLPLAARGVLGADDAAEAFRLAEERDLARTRLFRSLVAADSVRPELANGCVEQWFPATAEITEAHRAIWWATADGRYGDTIRTRLRDVLRNAFADDAEAQVNAWLDGRIRRQRARDAHQQAAQRAKELQSVLDGVRDASASSEPVADAVRAALTSLIDEGVPGERELLTALSQARADMAMDGLPEDDRPEWHAKAGNVLDLLLADLANGDAPARQRRFAADVLAPVLRRCVAEFEAATDAEPPSEQHLDVDGYHVTVTEDGTTDTGWREHVEARASARHTQPHWRLPVCYAAATVAGLGAALALVFGSVFLLLSVVGVAVGCWIFALYRQSAGKCADDVRNSINRYEGQIRSTARQIASDHARAATTRESVHAARESVDAVLAVSAQRPTRAAESPTRAG